MGYNRVILLGRLTKEPSLTETASGVSMCRFSLAVPREYKTADGVYQTDFFDCTAWRETADVIGLNCQKGSRVIVEGNVQPRQYEDNKGNKQKVVDIIVRNVEFLSPTAKSDEAGAPKAPLPQQAQARPQRVAQKSMFDAEEGDLPF